MIFFFLFSHFFVLNDHVSAVHFLRPMMYSNTILLLAHVVFYGLSRRFVEFTSLKAYFRGKKEKVLSDKAVSTGSKGQDKVKY